jgi:hypothetical protein
VTFSVKGPSIDASNFHGFQISIPRARYSSVVNGEDNGVVTVQCEVSALKPTDGITPIITMSATTTKDAILGL